MTEKWPPLDPGTRVETQAVEKPRTDWTEEAQSSRRFGVVGTILRHHDSHGLCYDVMHDDNGTEGCYDPLELKILPALKGETSKVTMRCTVCDVDLDPESVVLHEKCSMGETDTVDAPLDGNLPDLEEDRDSEKEPGFQLLELIQIDFDGSENDAVRATLRESVAVFVDEPNKTAFSKLDKFLKELAPMKCYLGWDEEVYPKFVVESKRAL